MTIFYTRSKFSILNSKIQSVSLFFVILLVVINSNLAFAQPCAPTVPTLTVNLRAKADTTWISPSIARRDLCCGSSNPDRCIQFIITLNPKAAGIIFNIASGAVPSGSMFYQVGCSRPTAVGQIICLTGPGPHILTFCKPGNNSNTYSITSVPKPYASNDIRIYDGCTGQISAYGFDTNTITWTSIYPSTTGRYNNYLSCSTGCSRVNVTPRAGFPAYVDYKVCGSSLNGCTPSPYCDTVRVYFFPKLISYIFPPIPAYCYLDSGLIISSGPMGGVPPYNYYWSNGSTTAKTFVDIGTYILRISDQTGCPPIYDTVTVSIDTPQVEAGPNDTVCFGYTRTIALNATGALYYKWQTDTTLSSINIPNPNVTPQKTTTYHVTGYSTVGEYIDNGDFSKGNKGFTSSYSYSSNLWPEGYYFVGNNPNANHSHWCTCGDHTTGTGNMMIINGATIAGVPIYSKTIDVIPYTSYAFSIWIQSVHPANPARLQFSVNGSLLGAPFTILSTVGLWQNFFTIWYSGASSVATLSIINQNTIASGNDFALDDVSFGAVCPNFDSVTVYVSNMSVTESIINNNCINGQSGSIDLTIFNGIPPYRFSWSNGDTTEDIANLRAGTYYVNIYDNAGCLYQDSFTITQPLNALSLQDSIVNVKCHGNTTGAIFIKVNNGVAPFNFVWSDGSDLRDIQNVSAGTYILTVTDSFGCVVLDSFEISEPDSIIIQKQIVNVNCFNGNNGLVNLTVSGGKNPYTYNWSNGDTTQDITNLVAGTYFLNLTDSNGCTIRDTAIISQPTQLTISHTQTNVSCYNGNNGTVDLTITGGTAAYTYLWSNNATTQDLSGLTAGTYSVTVTDSNGCTIRDTAIIIQPTQLTVSNTQTNVSCYNGSNGTIDLSITGGVTPYTYAWSNNATTQDLSGLTAGTYSVTVTDSNGCTIRDTAIIIQPDQLTISHTQTNVSCYNGNNGTVDLTISGGVKPYLYAWSNSATTQDLSSLTAGTYSVTVTDSNGCTIRDSAIISQPTQLTISNTQTNINCYNGNNGTVDLTITGGVTPYLYAWSNSATTQDLSGLTAGTYSVTVTDSNGCTITDTAIIIQPTQLTISHTQTNVSCYNGNNGTVDLTITGGTAAYTYLWSNNATTQDLSGLTAGTYSVTVTDSNGCTIRDTAIIIQPTQLTVSHTQTNVSCYNGNNGTIDLSITGGLTPYLYAWSNNATTQDLSGLTAGTYSVTVTDSNGCTIRDTAIIIQPTQLTISNTQTNVSCYNGSNGTIDLSITGGLTPYLYAWSNNATTQDLSGLSAGTYSVTVTDSNGCTIRDTAIIIQPTQLTISNTQTNVNCYNGNNGTVDLTITGGTAAYTYLWSNNATTQDLSGLSAGTYSVTVTDFNGCTIRDTAIIIQPTQLTISHTQTNVSCYNGNNGTVDLTITGGTAAYTYLWSNNATTQDLSGLSAGTYSVTVTDANGCTIRDTAIITQPTQLTISNTQTNVNCYNGNNGTVDLTITGGLTPYLYSWSNSVTTQDLSGLSAGTYSVTVTDSNGCTIRDTAIISQPTQLTISNTQTNVSCYNGSNGTIDLSITGGVTPYTYAWSNSTTTEDQPGLSAGTYSVTVTDANGCTIRDTAIIIQPTQLTISHTQTNVSCYNGNNGTVDLTITGGTAAYTYLWSNNATTQDLSGLSAGTYSVTVTDANGCTIRDTAIITQPTQLTISNTQTNVNCYNGNNGTVDLTITGGLTPYLYSWSNSVTTQDLSGLSAGTYSVTVTDSNGCTIRDTAIISQPTQLTISNTQTNVSCYNGSNGTIDLSITGGVTPYTYAWSNSTTTEDQPGLSAGTYSVTVTDANGCTIRDTAIISQPDQLTISHTQTNVSCYNGNNGTVDLTISGGVTPYLYAWSNSATTQDLSSLTAGTYSVTVTDSNGCTIRDSAIISQPTQLTISNTQTNINCYNGNNGTVDLTITGGVTPYLYSWSNSATTQDLSGLTAGTYSVTVTDSNGCTIRDTAIIIQPTQLTISHTQTNVSCYNGNNGTVDLTITGGTAAYTYLWSNNATTQDLSGLSAGTYSVTVTDSNGCTIIDTAIIIQPTQLTISNTQTNVSCYNGNNGTVDLTISGGVTPYLYAWSNSTTTEDQPGLSAGTYSVTVTDFNGCTIRDTAIITQPTQLTISNTQTNVNCYNGNNGTVDLIITGGTAAYTYLWSNNATTQDLSGLTAGTYSVTVTDSNGCTIRDTAIIIQPGQLTISHTQTNVSCYNGNNGTVDLTISGGVTPYTYAWSNSISSQDLSGLSAGTYSVTVTDFNGCTIRDTAIIIQPGQLTISHTQTNVSCYNGNNGTVDLTISGGVTPYTYAWSNSTTTEDQPGLSAGTYSVTVTDSNGCTIIDTAIIIQPTQLTISNTQTNVSCYNGNNGTVDLTISGGVTPYTYAWSNSTTTEDQPSLSAGTYSVTVTDFNGCTIRDTAIVIQPGQLTISHTQTNVSCYNGNNGTIDLSITGGVTPYLYAWLNNATTQDLSGLTAGTYSVTVTDSNGCTIRDTAIVIQPGQLTISHTQTNVSCYNGNNGTIDLSITGGVTPYLYAWSNNATTQDLSGLSAGTYSVTVTDSNGCTIRDTAIVIQPGQLTISHTQTNVSCYNGNNGTIDLSITGGTPAYTYLWSNSISSQDLSGLTAGTYSVTVTDANGCTISDTAIITQPTQLTVSHTQTNVSCFNGSNGTIDLSIAGGVTPYTFAWSNSTTTEDQPGLSAGTYSVTVTDFNGCTIRDSAIITHPTQLTISHTQTNVSCYNGNNGTVDLTISGGVTPYLYAWSNSATTQDLSSLTAGTYSVTVTDSNGCTIRDSAIISQPTHLTISHTQTNINCYNGNNGTVDLTITGGTPVYTYLWSNSISSQDLSGLSAGTYSVTVTDAKGCTIRDTAFISQPNQLTISHTLTNVNCYNGSNGTVDLTIAGGVSPYTYAWSNSISSQDLSGLTTGTYSVTVTDFNGCTIRDTAIISQPDQLTISHTQTHVSCYNGNNGTVDLTISGGVTPYLFTWSNNATTQDLSGLTACTYSVTVTDSNGCTIRDTAIITQPGQLTISHTQTHVSCYNGNNGTVDLIITGGTAAYTYLWSNNATTQDLSGLTAGTYSVTVTDSNGCTIRDTAIVIQPTQLTISNTQTNVNCYNGNNGTVDLTITGGTAAYTYLWSNNATTQDLSGLTAGTYSVTVTDANGCTIRDTAIIIQPTQLTISHTQTNVSCYNGSNGTIDLTIAGGVAPYSYAWSNSTTTEDQSGLTASTYSVTVTDSNGCTIRDTAIISQPGQLTVSHTQTNVSCYNGNNGTVDLTITGGVTPYLYAWSNNATTQDLSGLTADTYSVTVNDSNGCTIRDTAIILQPNQLTISHTQTNVSCYNGNNGTVDLTISGGVTPYTYAWSNSATTQDLSGLSAGTYSVTVTDSNGCTIRDTAIITQPGQLTISHTLTNVSCYNGNNGTIDLSIAGGVAPYSYAWSNNTTTQDLSGLTAGTYSVTVTDANGCTIRDTAIISQPTQLTVSHTQTNVSCYNGSNGTVDLTITGGTPAYTYLWSNSLSSQDLSGLSAGTYSVTVTDSNGCTIRDTAIVIQPGQLTISHTQTNVSCYNGNNGTVDLTISGGVTPYTYAWSNSTTTEDQPGLSAGTYSVTVTDANGCTIRDTVIITQPDQLTISHTQTNVSCYNGNNGTVDLTITGGTAAYTYLWSNNATTQDLSGLSAGTYSVTVTDANGCTISDTAIITQPTQLTVSYTQTNVNCYNGSNGTIDLTITGGTAAYTYLWSNNATTQDLSGLTVGTYSVTVTDSNGCTIRDTAIILQPGQLTISHTQTNVSCYNGNNGTIDLSITGGLTPFLYAWSNNATTQDLSGLTAGTYSVTVTDSNGCTIRDTAIITQPTQLTVSYTQTNVSCYNGNNGTVDLTITGGVTPYLYAWSNSVTTQDLSGLSAGTYSVTVTDANGCTIRDTVIITQPDQLTISHTQTNVSCYNGNNGTIDLSITGGLTPYLYAWSNNATTQDLSGLTAGTYSVTVTDSNGCTIRDTAIITQPTQLTVSYTQTNVSCYNGNNGTVDLTITGGVTPYLYAWSNSVTTQDLSGLSAGTYSVTVTDANGCTIRDTVIITQPDQLTISHTQTNVSCYNGNNGTVDLTITGGTAAYTYLWSNNATTQDLSGLSAGTYSVTVTDANGCTISDTAIIIQPTQLTISQTQTNVSCYNGSNGLIDLSIAGGVTPYTYAWSNSTSSQDLSGLTAGTYSVTVNDSNGCTIRDTAIIIQPTQLTISHTQTNVSCYNGNNGTVDLTISGGVTPYTYAWSNSFTTQDLSGLSAGTYSVTVNDSNGCTIRDTAIIIQPNQLTISHTQTNVSCYNGSNGTIDLTITGGTAAYTYLWSNNATTQDLSGLSAGTYSVTVTDANGCTIRDTAIVIQPGQLTISHTQTNVSCYNGNNGTVDLTISGGVTPYTYAWSNSVTTQDLSGLSAGTYSVTVTDANGCTISDTAIITQPTQLTVSYTQTNVNCYNGSNGTIDLTITGGTAAYTYLWSNNATTQDLSGLTAGTYSVTVTDFNGCTIRDTAIITQPTQLTISHTQTNVSCYNGNNGTIDLSITGGLTPYLYAWSNNATTQDLSGLTAGTYSVTVTDSNGCTIRDTAIVIQPGQLTISHTQTNVSCYNGNNGTVDLTISGGVTPYLYAWSNNATTQDLSGLTAGTYSVTVTDFNGCTIRDTAIIIQPGQLTISHTQTNVSCYNGNNGTVDLTISGGVTPYTYAWSNSTTTEDQPGLSAGTYSVTVTDFNGCTIRDTAIVIQPGQLTISHTQTNVSCYNGNNGTIDLSITGGLTPYLYAWSNSATTQDLSGLSAGTYSVTVTDFNGCTIRDTAIIIQPTQLTVSHTQTNVSCYNGNNGTVDLTISGGVTPYTYAWSNSITTQDLSGLTAGTYSVTVTDANGCTISDTAIITQPTQLTVSYTQTNVNCYNGSNGTIDLTITGGTAAYTYLWLNNATTQDLSGLSAGTYSVTVTDSNGCTIRDTAIITQPTQLTISHTQTNVNCYNGNNGTVDLTITGGTAAYTYLWSNSATTQDLSGLSAGTYSVTVTDANGCTIRDTVIITQPDQLTISHTQTHVSCYNGNNGTVDLTISGGVTPYLYAWSNNATTQDLSGLTAGTYSVTVTDSNGCTIRDTAIITQPGQLTISHTQTNVSCYNGNNGTIDITVTGGTLAYSFNWSNISSNQDQTGLSIGVYSVEVTDANGCKVRDTAVITEPSLLTISHTQTNVSCFNGTNGSINITVSGGTSPYNYNWSNSLFNEDQAGITAGTYSLIITDVNGCLLRDTFIITQPNELSIFHNRSNVSCYNGSDGSINTTVTGGVTPYNFNWSNATASEDQTGLTAGSYTVYVTDANFCVISDTIIIEQPDLLSVTHAQTNVNCYNGSNGTINLTVNGGIAPYHFLWSNNSTVEDQSGLSFGSYGVEVIDSLGCKFRDTFEIIQPMQLIISHSQTNVSCYNGSNGMIDLSVSGGITPYTYSWSNSTSIQDQSGLTAGTYSILITDSNGCNMSDTISIMQPDLLSITHAVKDANCFNSSNGSINITVSGGVNPYNFIWSNSSVTEDLSGLGVGSYHVQVTDSNGCSARDTALISQPDLILISQAVSNVSCNGGADASVNISVNGGVAPYSYLWSNNSTLEDLSGLNSGVYILELTDSNGCKTTDSILITQPDLLTSKVATTDVLCFGESNGSVDLNVTGGVQPYSYSWSNYNNSKSQNALPAGKYTVIITDLNNCIKLDSAEIIQPDKLMASSSISDVKCKSGNDGSIKISVSGGLEPYSYLWSNNETSDNIDSVIAGSYQIIIIDKNLCSISDTFTLNEPINSLNITSVVANVKCNGLNDGGIDLSTTGGTAPYAYHWSNGSYTQDLTSLWAGAYKVIVRDTNGCFVTDSFEINQPDVLTAVSKINHVICNGGNQGEIQITVNGGVSPYSYNWSNGDTTSSVSSLSKGNYIVNIKDANNCFLNQSYEIQEAASIVYEAKVQNIKCFGGNDGSAIINVNGGIPPYKYIWSTGDTTKSLAELIAGIYRFAVSDSVGCTKQDSIKISEPLQLTHKIVKKDISCFNFKDGSIDMIITGGTLPYSYLWSNNSTSKALKNLNKGTFSVLVTDSNKCSISDSVIINESPELMIISKSKNVSCYSGNDGQIKINIVGGKAPYRFNWSNGSSKQNQDSLKSGRYNLIVEDSNACKTFVAVTILQSDPISISKEVTDASCFNKKDGSIKIKVSGGNGPYVYTWSTGDSTSSLSNVGAGKYFINISDKNICPKSDSAQINQPPPVMMIDYTIKNISCYRKNDGSISVSVRGGTPPYYFKWSDGKTTKDVSGLSAGYYSVTVYDAHNCVYLDSLKILEPKPLDIQFFTMDEKCEGDKNGFINITVHGGVSPYHYIWSTKDSVEDLKNLTPGKYSVKFVDAYGCDITKDNISISTSPLPDPKILAEEYALYCKQDSILLSVTEEFSKYSWNTGDTGRFVTINKPGDYYVKVTNSSECSDSSAAISIDMKDPFKDVGFKDAFYMCPDDESQIVLYPGYVSGATYHWLPGEDTTSELTVTGQGRYSVNITKGNCNIQYEADVYELCEPSIFIPNVFSPNNDGVNDGFFPVTRYIDTLTFIIFNRWGEILYRGYGIDDKWDGTFKGEVVMSDTYAYIVNYKNRKWSWKQKSGSVNVLR